MNIDLSKVKVGQICVLANGAEEPFQGKQKHVMWPYIVGGCSYTKSGRFYGDDAESRNDVVSIKPILSKAKKKAKPTTMRFESNCAASIKQVQAIFTQRGAEYADTWGEAVWVKTVAAAKHLGITLTNDQARKIAAAVLVDVKYWRDLGGYKEDNQLDGIAYGLNFLAEMKGGKK